MLIIERLALTAALALIVTGLCYALRRAWSKRVIARSQEATPAEPAANPALTLHYFWSKSCTACRVQEIQIQELERLLASLGRSISVARHDAVTELELTLQMRIVTVPTTVLTGLDGQILGWNPGLTTSRALMEQLRTRAGLPMAAATTSFTHFRRIAGETTHIPSYKQGTGS
jgi:hypothetical protein